MIDETKVHVMRNETKVYAIMDEKIKAYVTMDKTKAYFIMGESKPQKSFHTYNVWKPEPVPIVTLLLIRNRICMET